MSPDLVRYPVTGHRESEKRLLDAELANAKAQLAERTDKLTKAIEYRDGAVKLVAVAEQALRDFKRRESEPTNGH